MKNIFILIVVLVIILVIFLSTGLFPQNVQTNTTDYKINNVYLNGNCSDSDKGVNESVKGVASPNTPYNVLYVDTCESQKSLREFFCQTTSEHVVKGNNVDVITTYNATVSSHSITCTDVCSDGRCISRCPKYGDTLTYSSIDKTNGNATLRDQNNDLMYDCVVVYDSPYDNYSCQTTPYVGLNVYVYSLGGSTYPNFCNGGDTGSIVIDDRRFSQSQKCTYFCTVKVA